MGSIEEKESLALQTTSKQSSKKETSVATGMTEQADLVNKMNDNSKNDQKLRTHQLADNPPECKACLPKNQGKQGQEEEHKGRYHRDHLHTESPKTDIVADPTICMSHVMTPPPEPQLQPENKHALRDKNQNSAVKSPITSSHQLETGNENDAQRQVTSGMKHCREATTGLNPQSSAGHGPVEPHPQELTSTGSKSESKNPDLSDGTIIFVKRQVVRKLSTQIDSTGGFVVILYIG